MASSREGPAFGTADLSNCERELIHLPGSVQPHGLLLVLEPGTLRIRQATQNAEAVVDVAPDELLDRPLGDVLDPALADAVRNHLPRREGTGPHPFLWRRGERDIEALVHAPAREGILLELDPVPPDPDRETVPERLIGVLDAVEGTVDLGRLVDATAAALKALTGYDRVMVYRFDPDGHGEVVAEAKEPPLEPYLGLHYPASDIPMRARELYLRNRVRVLVDVDYAPSPLLPRLSPVTGGEVDMSMCFLRSMSPLHLQYLRNMGVTATLVASLVKDGELWGLIACHHYGPKRLPYAVRAAVEVACEVFGARLSALENQALAGAEAHVRRVEEVVLAATSSGRDWRTTLLEDPGLLLTPLGAGGVSVAFDGEIRSAGEVPSTAQIRCILSWVGAQGCRVAHTRSLPLEEPRLEALRSVAAGVLAVPVSEADGEYILWYRPEQRRTVRWAGNPRKPVHVGDDPRDLSPRRSFAVWTEQVRGKARHWSAVHLELAQRLGRSLQDLVVQVRALSYLVTLGEAKRYRSSLQQADEAILLADPEGRILFVNQAFSRLFRRPHPHLSTLDDVPGLFADRARIFEIMDQLRLDGHAWRGEARLEIAPREAAPVAVRMEAVRRQGERPLGYVMLLDDLRPIHQAESTIRRIAQSLARRPRSDGWHQTARLESAIRRSLERSASAAEIPQEGAARSLESVEEATRRALDLTRRIVEFREGRGPTPVGDG